MMQLDINDPIIYFSRLFFMESAIYNILSDTSSLMKVGLILDTVIRG